MADRILGMGDIVSMVENVAEAVNEEDAMRSMKRIRKWMHAIPDRPANTIPMSIGPHCTACGDVSSLSPS
jgi:hypothetical protein